MLIERAVAVVVVGGALAGCGYDRGIAGRTQLGGNTPLASLTPGAAQGEDGPGTATVSLSRDEWRPMDFVVPVDGTVHGPLWRWDARGRRDTARQKALYPTAESALEVGRGTGVREALVQPFLSVGNVVALPVLAFMDPPGNHLSPSRSTLYKRSVRGRPVAGAVPPPEGEPVDP